MIIRKIIIVCSLALLVGAVSQRLLAMDPDDHGGFQLNTASRKNALESSSSDSEDEEFSEGERGDSSGWENDADFESSDEFQPLSQRWRIGSDSSREESLSSSDSSSSLEGLSFLPEEELHPAGQSLPQGQNVINALSDPALQRILLELEPQDIAHWAETSTFWCDRLGMASYEASFEKAVEFERRLQNHQMDPLPLLPSDFISAEEALGRIVALPEGTGGRAQFLRNLLRNSEIPMNLRQIAGRGLAPGEERDALFLQAARGAQNANERLSFLREVSRGNAEKNGVLEEMARNEALPQGTRRAAAWLLPEGEVRNELLRALPNLMREVEDEG